MLDRTATSCSDWPIDSGFKGQLATPTAAENPSDCSSTTFAWDWCNPSQSYNGGVCSAAHTKSLTSLIRLPTPPLHVIQATASRQRALKLLDTRLLVVKLRTSINKQPRSCKQALSSSLSLTVFRLPSSCTAWVSDNARTCANRRKVYSKEKAYRSKPVRHSRETTQIKRIPRGTTHIYNWFHEMRGRVAHPSASSLTVHLVLRVSAVSKIYELFAVPGASGIEKDKAEIIPRSLLLL